jgi:hypothetical protein
MTFRIYNDDQQQGVANPPGPQQIDRQFYWVDCIGKATPALLKLVFFSY